MSKTLNKYITALDNADKALFLLSGAGKCQYYCRISIQYWNDQNVSENHEKEKIERNVGRLLSWPVVN